VIGVIDHEPLPDSIPELGFRFEGSLVLRSPAAELVSAFGGRGELLQEIPSLLKVRHGLVHDRHRSIVT
jgi:hypothetical protein